MRAYCMRWPLGMAGRWSVSFERVSPRMAGIVIGLLFAMTTCGCGNGSETEQPRAAVRGTVTLDGKPLPEGVIRFIPIEGTPGPKTSALVFQGQFSLEKEQGPLAGKHRIAIESTDNGGYAPDDEQALWKLKAAGIRRIDAVRIPAIYNTQSTLTEAVSAEGPNEFAFDLKSQNRR